jgi:hypothetical protein
MHGVARTARMSSPAITLTLLAACVLALAFAPSPAAAADPNPVVLENQLPGTSAWRLGQGGARVADDANGQIKGYASRTSVDKGESIQFKVSVAPVQEYTIAIYRMGCYPNAAGACLGGRFMTELGPFAGTSQPACPLDGPAGTNTGLIECDWSGPSYTIPTGWTSGVYLAVLTNDANYQNYVSFVVRDDARQAALLYQQPVMNYQAYNPYPWYGDGDARNGKSLYDNKSGGADTIAGAGRPRAVKVSFDRPYAGDGAGELLDENGWSWEGYFIRWIEQHGYDVAYSTSLDTHQHPERLLDHHGWLSVGHDEYWTTQMYDAAEAARDAGIHLGFFGANDIYWQARLEPSSHGQTDRTMVVYKNSPNNTFTTNDPIADPALKTVRFQDPPVNRPAQTLLGQSFVGSTARSTANTPLKVADASDWPFAGSGFTDGAEVPQIVGYEADGYSCQYAPPVNTGYDILAKSLFNDSDGYTQYSNASIYRAPSGAQVFYAGTMSWSWALDRPGFVDPRIQTTTQNLLDVISGATVAPDSSGTVPDCSDHRNLTFESGQLAARDPDPAATSPDRALGSLALETANPISGDYSLRVPNAPNSYIDERVVPAGDFSLEFKLRLRGLPASDVRLAVTNAVIPATLGNIIVRASGLVCLRNGNAWVGGVAGTACTSTPLTVGTTYRLKLHQVQGTGGDGILQGFVAPAGDEFGAPFAKTTTTAISQKVDRFQLGSSTNVVLDAVFDDVTVDGKPQTIPEPASGLEATSPVDSTRVYLSWSDETTSETSYVVERSTSATFDNPARFVLPADSESYTDTSVTESTQYFYRVRAANAAGQSDPSNVASVTTREPPPAGPTNLQATWPSASTTQLSWSDNASNETGYILERAGNSSFSDATTVDLPPNTTSYADAGLAPGVYYYRVRATNGASLSSNSNTARGPRIKDVTFEDGTPSLVHAVSGASRNAGSLVLQESVSPIAGSFSARVPNIANAYIEQSVTPDRDDLFTSLYLRLNVRPTVDNRIVQVMSGNTVIGNVWIRANGTLCLKYGNAWSGGSTGAGCTPTASPLQTGVTYRIAVRQTRGDGSSNAVIEGWWAVVNPLGGEPALTRWTSTSVAPSGAGYWTTQPTVVRVGATLTGTPLDAVFDDVRLDAGFMPGASTLP